jgi:hypothetical protein
MNHTNILQAIEKNVITVDEGLAFDLWVFDNQHKAKDVILPDELRSVLERILKMGAH